MADDTLRAALKALRNDWANTAYRMVTDERSDERRIAMGRHLQGRADDLHAILAAQPANPAPAQRDTEEYPATEAMHLAADQGESLQAAQRDTEGLAEALREVLTDFNAQRVADHLAETWLPAHDAEIEEAVDARWVLRLADLCDDDWLRRRDRAMGLQGSSTRVERSASSAWEHAAHELRQVLNDHGYEDTYVNRHGSYLRWLRAGRDATAAAVTAPDEAADQ